MFSLLALSPRELKAERGGPRRVILGVDSRGESFHTSWLPRPGGRKQEPIQHPSDRLGGQGAIFTSKPLWRSSHVQHDPVRHRWVARDDR